MQTNVGSSSGGNSRWSDGCRSFIRRKQVDSVHGRRKGGELSRRLSAVDLVAIGVGSTIGAGVYILVGTVAREQAGPALPISFLIAGIAAALSAFCYIELAGRCPSAGSAYHYSYICVGEGVAWLVGWALMLEYTIGGSAVARGISPNLALFFIGGNKLPVFIARHTIPRVGVVVDPCAAVLILIVTGLLCIGIKESSFVQAIVTTVNVCVMGFIVIAGGYLAFKNGWAGYGPPSGYFPFGVNGMLAGSGIVFFSYIGFDAVTGTVEEVNNPQRDLPLGIGIALCLCCILYMLVSIVIVGLVPYNELDPDSPISLAFANYGMKWAVYVITTGAVTALCSSLMGSLLPQPRTLMAMARDGLLPSFFSDINKHTHVPVKSTILTGLFAAALAFFMDVSQLAEMVSVGTLLAFTTSAVSVLIVRYVPPDVVPLPLSLQKSIDSIPFGHGRATDGLETSFGFLVNTSQPSHQEEKTSIVDALIGKEVAHDEQNEQRRRKFAAWSITLLCLGVVFLASVVSVEHLPSFPQFFLCGVGGFLLLGGLVVLVCLGQDDGRRSFGHTGGFICPFVPFLPALCILINVYLLINLGVGTWIRVSVWLLIGAPIYVCYGRKHSSLVNAVYVPAAHANEIYRTSSHYLV